MVKLIEYWRHFSWDNTRPDAAPWDNMISFEAKPKYIFLKTYLKGPRKQNQETINHSCSANDLVQASIRRMWKWVTGSEYCEWKQLINRHN